MTDSVSVCCRRCGQLHLAEVLERDADGFATETRFLERCPSEALAEVVDAAAQVFVIGVDTGRYEIAEQGLDAVLSLLDEEGHEDEDAR